jgi:glycogen phosphorylase
VGELPMELAIRANGEPVMVQITAWTGPIKARVWRLKVGRCDMAVTEVFGSPTGFCSGTDTKSWVY